MNQHKGVSLTELVMTMAIVSVIGAGAYVGIQQLEEARTQVETRATQMANAQLLLPLIEMEQARHGQQVANGQPACLIQQVGSAWLNTCKGDQVEPPAPGFITCRIDNNDQAIRTVVYHASAANKPDEKPEVLYRLFRETYETDDCDLTDGEGPADPAFFGSGKDLSEEANLQSVASRFVLSDEVEQFTVGYAADGSTLENQIRFISQDTLVTQGDSTSTQGNALDFESSVTQSLLQDDRPVLSFGTDALTIASGVDPEIYVFSNRPVYSDIIVQWQIGTASGSASLEAGKSRTTDAISIAHASTADPLTILATDDYLLGDTPLLSFTVTDSFTPNVRFRVGQTTLSYGGSTEAVEVFLTGAASGATAIGMEVEDASCTESDDTYTLSYDTSSNCEIVINVPDGQRQISESLNFKAASSGSDGSVNIVINAASSSEHYGRDGTPEIRLNLVSDLPEISFLSSGSTAIEPGTASNRHRVVLLSDTRLPRDLIVNLSLTAASATCGSSSDFKVPDQSCGDSYETTFPAGQFEHAFEVDIYADSSADDDETLELSLSNGAYDIDGSADEHSITISEYSIVSFANSSITSIEESDGTATIALNIEPAAQTELKLKFASAAVGDTNTFIDWSFADNPLTVTQGSSSANLTLNLTNDSVPEGTEKIEISFVAADFIGEALAGTPDSTTLTVTDEEADLCYPAGNLTIGTSSSDHFHDTNETDSVTGELITGGSVQISDGFNKDTDSLVIKDKTADADSPLNVVEYSNISFTVGSKTYVFDANYTETSGVMLLTIDPAGSNPDSISSTHLVKFFKEKVLFETDDFSETQTRKIIFTLGNAQAWNQHEDGSTHYYRFVESGTEDDSESGGNGTNNDGINFIPAFNNAKDSTYFGVPGYLATVTSKAENDFLAEKFKIDGQPSAGWLGGSNHATAPTGISASDWPSSNVLGPTDETSATDLKTGFKYGWVNGPDKGKLFWSGLGGCGDPINASSNTQVDIFPKNNDDDDGDEDDVRTSPQTNGRCYYNFGDDWLAVTNQTIAALRCVAQEADFNGQDHSANSPYQMTYGYDYDNELLNGRVNSSANTYRFSNFGCAKKEHTFNEPNYWKKKEYFVQLTGLAAGGRTWNDLSNDPNLQTNDSSLIYNVKGYYLEFGGANTDSTWGFSGKKLSQTNTVTPYKCQVSH